MTLHNVVSMDMATAGFGAGFIGTSVPAYTGTDNSPWLVEINPSYQFDNPEVSRALVHAWTREHERPEARHRKGIYLFGPTGSGKTSVIEQFFARLRVPLVRITWSPRREAEDLLQSKTLLDGTLLSVDQAIVLAARNGFPVLINEIDLAEPGELVAFNEVIERGLVTCPDGTTVQAKRGFVVICTGNTAGAEDEEGVYHGTRSQNAAFLRRFFSLRLGYPDEAAEVSFLKSQLPSVKDEILTAAAKVAIKLRQAFEGTADNLRLTASISRPEVVDWVEAMARFRYLTDRGVNVAQYALGLVFSNRLPASDQRAVQEIVQASFLPESSTQGQGTF